MRHSGEPRVVITGIGVVSPFGVGRERFWEHVSRGCSGTRAITEFDASEFACRVAAPVSGVTIDDVPALEGDDIWDAAYRADPKRYSRAALIGVIAAREAWIDAGLRDRRAGGRRRHRQRRRRHRRRRAAVLRLLRRARPQGHAVRDPGLDRRDDVERDLDLAAAARHQPRAVVRLHELDRRDRLRGGADSLRRGRRAAVGRRRRVRDARHDLRLLADARRVDGVQRSPGRRVAAVRPRPRRLRPRRGRVDGGARARGSRARARRRRSTPRSTATARPATPITACRWRPTATRSSARSRWRSSARAAQREEIGYVSYHGTSTVLNDAVESRCVRQVFGAHADRLAGLVGQVDDRPPAGRQRRGRHRHAPRWRCQRGFLPPTINQTDPDPACDLDFIPNHGRARRRSRRRCATASGSDRRTARW